MTRDEKLHRLYLKLEEIQRELNFLRDDTDPVKVVIAKPDDGKKVMRQFRNRRGLAVKIAKACGVTPAAVRQWAAIPPRHVLAVSKLVRMEPHKIRPDIFPVPK